MELRLTLEEMMTNVGQNYDEHRTELNRTEWNNDYDGQRLH
jgi:hypothetical protein